MYHFVIGVVRGADEHDASLRSERSGNNVLIRLPSLRKKTGRFKIQDSALSRTHSGTLVLHREAIT